MTRELADSRSKDWWRSEMKRRLSAIKNGDEISWDGTSRIARAVQEITETAPGLWLAFSATRHEPHLPPPPSMVTYAFPRMVADHESENAAAKMTFYVWTGEPHSAAWSVHRFGIREPDISNAQWSEVDAGAVEIRGALIPGLGFDRWLHRLGRGAGFYDRFLAIKKRQGSLFLKVGVGFAVQLTDELPHESHDARLDALVTDHEVIWRMTDDSVARSWKVDAS